METALREIEAMTDEYWDLRSARHVARAALVAAPLFARTEADRLTPEYAAEYQKIVDGERLPGTLVSKRATAAAFAAPAVGQRFSEHCSYWIYVVEVEGGRIVTLEGSPPVTFPDTAERREYAGADEFRARFAYQSIPGYWVTFVDDGHDVTGWATTGDVPAPRAHEENT